MSNGIADSWIASLQSPREVPVGGLLRKNPNLVNQKLHQRRKGAAVRLRSRRRGAMPSNAIEDLLCSKRPG